MLCRRISRYGTRFPRYYIYKSTAIPVNKGDPPRARGRNAPAPALTMPRGRREYPVYASRSSRAPALCSRSFHCCRSCGLCYADSRFLGSGVSGTSPGLRAAPLRRGRRVGSYLCLGVSFAPIAVSRNTLAPLAACACPVLRPGCPCRAPAPGAAGAPGGTPLRGSRFARHSGVPPGVFFRLARCLAVRGAGCFPSVQWPEVCHPAPLPERP